MTSPFPIAAQPDDITCGPTALHALYRHFGDEVPLTDVIAEVPPMPTGGTLAAHLGTHALGRGYTALLYTFNLALLDPTWLGLPNAQIVAKLREQRLHKHDERLNLASEAYVEFLEHGGSLRMADLSAPLLASYLREGVPLLAGLSATYLYDCRRELPDTGEPSDVRGAPVGHFVVLHGYDEALSQVQVADPWRANPLVQGQHYAVDMDRLATAVLLGVLTFDGNLLVLQPPTDVR